MNSNPLLTIAVPTYNRARLLGICLDSIVDQLREFPDQVEVLVSNNASTDNTRDVVKSYLDAFPQIRYMESQSNRGMDYNFQKCFELARAEYVWLVSDDDLLLPRAIERIVPLLQSQELGIVTLTASFYPCKGDLNKLQYPYESLSSELYYDPRKLAREAHFWLTYITGVIVNKRIASDCGIHYPSGESCLIQLGWVFPALFSKSPSATVHTRLILGRGLEVLDFKPFWTFGNSYPAVLNELADHNILPSDAKEMLIDLIIEKYFAPYIHPKYTYYHGEHPLLILGKAFWRRKAFWLHLFPRFVYRAFFRALGKTGVSLPSIVRVLKTRLGSIFKR